MGIWLLYRAPAGAEVGVYEGRERGRHPTEAKAAAAAARSRSEYLITAQRDDDSWMWIDGSVARPGGWQRMKDARGTARAANANIYPDGSVAMEPSTIAVPLRNDMSTASMADAEIITHYGQRFWDAMSARVNAMTYAATSATPTTRRRADEIDAE